MPTKITWLGHNCWLLETAGHTLIIDPFLEDSPTSSMKAAEVEVDFVLVSHGHFDHIADAATITKRTEATVLANFEVASWLQGEGVPEEHCIGMNPGGGIDQPFGRVEMTTAHHSSSFPEGSYAGVACGIVIESAGKRIYFACDTALFSDMRLIGRKGLDLAVLPIGDQFTMGPADSVEATKLLSPAKVLPCHYNTWPPIEQDAEAWARTIQKETDAEPIVLQPGESLVL